MYDCPLCCLFLESPPDTSKALRSWGTVHRGLQMALAERGYSGEMVHVFRTDEEFDRAEAVLRSWGKPSGHADPDVEIQREVARIERAILQGTVTVLGEFGGLQAAMKRSVALEKQVRSPPATDRSTAAALGYRCAYPESGSDERATCHATTGV